jgi:hypothetical protein
MANKSINISQNNEKNILEIQIVILGEVSD